MEEQEHEDLHVHVILTKEDDKVLHQMINEQKGANYIKSKVRFYSITGASMVAGVYFLWDKFVEVLTHVPK